VRRAVGEIDRDAQVEALEELGPASVAAEVEYVCTKAGSAGSESTRVTPARQN
jgi:hypothetical protein